MANATHFRGKVFAEGSRIDGTELTNNPKQGAIANVTGTTGISGTDSVNAAAVLTAIQALESKVNAVLVALREANIISS